LLEICAPGTAYRGYDTHMGEPAFAVFLVYAVLGTVDVGQKNTPPDIRMPIKY
jgi:hypothetical protein